MSFLVNSALPLASVRKLKLILNNFLIMILLMCLLTLFRFANCHGSQSILDKNYLQEATKRVKGLVTELCYRRDCGGEVDFQVERNLSLLRPEEQLERELRMKEFKWTKELLARIKIIEDKNQRENMTRRKACRHETRYRHGKIK